MKLTDQQLAQVDRAMVLLQTALVAREVYWAEHNAATTPIRDALAILTELHSQREHLPVMLLPDRLVCADMELPSSPAIAPMLGARALARQVSCITFRRGLTSAELGQALDFLSAKGQGGQPPALEHVGLGSMRVSASGPAAGGGGSGGAGAASEVALQRAHDCVSTISNFWSTLDAGACLEARRLEQAAAGVLSFLDACSGAAIPLAALLRHDHYTAVHTTNVAVLSAALATAVGLPPATIHDITIGALLHDVGKQRISTALLGKAGKLDEKEFAAMRRHPVEGAKMLAAAQDVPELAIIIAYEHHMLPDGTGYPAIAPGRSIHLASRIVQLGDVYDALGTHRPYRRAMSAADIRALMLARSGTAYEADLCGEFLGTVIARAVKPPAPTLSEPQRAAA